MAGMKLTIELPEILLRQIQERQVSEAEIHTVVYAALELWLAERSEKRTSSDAVQFVKQLIADNRELFELLAKKFILIF